MRPLTFPMPPEVIADFEDPGNPPIGYVRCVILYGYDNNEDDDEYHTLRGPIIAECGPGICDNLAEIVQHNVVTRYLITDFGR